MALDATDPSPQLAEALSRARHGGQWLRENVKYKAWSQSRSSSALWLIAKSGHGKSTLAAHVWRMISETRAENHDFHSTGKDCQGAVVLHLAFTTSRLTDLRAATNAFRSMIAQLARQVPEMLSFLVEESQLLSSEEELDLSLRVLSRLLKSIFNHLDNRRSVYIVIDALHNCDAQSRAFLIDWISDVMGHDILSVSPKPTPTTGPSVKVLITCRSDNSLHASVSAASRIDIGPSMTIHAMRAFIRNRSSVLAARYHLDKALISKSTGVLVEPTQGSFIWAKLVLEDLERCLKYGGEGAMLADLTQLALVPTTLSDVYDGLINRLNKQSNGHMFKTLRWLLYCTRPPSLEELREGLRLEMGEGSWPDLQQYLRVNAVPFLRVGGSKDLVTFVHSTARKHLEKMIDNTNTTVFNSVDMSPATANERLFTACIQHFLQEECLISLTRRLEAGDRASWREVLQTHFKSCSFCEYAIDSWIVHLQAMEHLSGDRKTLDLMIILFEHQDQRDGLMALTAFARYRRPWTFARGFTGLHLACHFDLVELTKLYVSEDRASVNATTAEYRCTPLILASEVGSVDCVKVLLDAGANVNTKESDGWRPLHWSARNGHFEVTKMLLQKNADSTAGDRDGNTPFDWAIDRQHWEVAALLDPSQPGTNLSAIDLKHRAQQLKTERFAREPWQLKDFRLELC